MGRGHRPGHHAQSIGALRAGETYKQGCSGRVDPTAKVAASAWGLPLFTDDVGLESGPTGVLTKKFQKTLRGDAR